ncbi:hypothetical protein V6Z05_00495 [Leptospira venezuelensis]|uniref:hypothetical protein n=1 Tax=Leptospira venezuelensis TaxID=1958811 RepID=UPI000A3B4A49|nr:hypothetical protein [Leptospira venezuelensis]
MDLTNEYYQIETETRDLKFWKRRDGLSEETKNIIKNANLMIVPWDFKRELAQSSFPVKTEEIFQFFKQNAEGNVEVDISENESDYRELALHGDIVWLGTFVVSSIIVPVFVNILNKYLEKRIINNTNPIIQINVIIDPEGKADQLPKKFSYKKPYIELENYRKDLVLYSKYGSLEKKAEKGGFNEIV